MEVASVAEAAAQGDIVMILVPDERQRAVYEEHVAPNLKDGAMLMFAHGFNIHFKQIVPPASIDVAMVDAIKHLEDGEKSVLRDVHSSTGGLHQPARERHRC